MAIENVVVRGRVGFNADDVEFIFTHGLGVGEVVIGDITPIRGTRRDPSQVTRTRSEPSSSLNQPTRKEPATEQ